MISTISFSELSMDISIISVADKWGKRKLVNNGLLGEVKWPV